MRPLGIPAVKDRIVQTALKLVIEPIFEARVRDRPVTDFVRNAAARTHCARSMN